MSSTPNRCSEGRPPVQRYIDSLCPLPDRQPAAQVPKKAKGKGGDLGTKDAGVTKPMHAGSDASGAKGKLRWYYCKAPVHKRNECPVKKATDQAKVGTTPPASSISARSSGKQRSVGHIANAHEVLYASPSPARIPAWVLSTGGGCVQAVLQPCAGWDSCRTQSMRLIPQEHKQYVQSNVSVQKCEQTLKTKKGLCLRWPGQRPS